VSSIRRIAVLLGLVLAVAAGCGGDDEPTLAEYEEAVVQARDRTDYALARITRSKSMDELVERLTEGGVLIDAAAEDLEDEGAPEVFAKENEKLVTSLKALGNDVRLTGEQILQPGFEDLLLGARGLNFDNWDKVNIALASLIGDGIKVELLATHTPEG
jgi:hypothetical protein